MPTSLTTLPTSCIAWLTVPSVPVKARRERSGVAQLKPKSEVGYWWRNVNGGPGDPEYTPTTGFDGLPGPWLASSIGVVESQRAFERSSEMSIGTGAERISRPPLVGEIGVASQPLAPRWPMYMLNPEAASSGLMAPIDAYASELPSAWTLKPPAIAWPPPALFAGVTCSQTRPFPGAAASAAEASASIAIATTRATPPNTPRPPDIEPLSRSHRRPRAAWRGTT